MDGASFLYASMMVWLKRVKVSANSLWLAVSNLPSIWAGVCSSFCIKAAWCSRNFANMDLIRTIVYKIYGPVLPSKEANLSISKM